MEGEAGGKSSLFEFNPGFAASEEVERGRERGGGTFGDFKFRLRPSAVGRVGNSNFPRQSPRPPHAGLISRGIIMIAITIILYARFGPTLINTFITNVYAFIYTHISRY